MNLLKESRESKESFESTEPEQETDPINENQVFDMANLANVVQFPKHEIESFEHQSDCIEMNNNSTELLFPSLTFEMDIQEEVVVTTSIKANELLASNEVNAVKPDERKAKVKRRTHSQMKRRRTMDENSVRSGKIISKREKLKPR